MTRLLVVLTPFINTTRGASQQTPLIKAVDNNKFSMVTLILIHGVDATLYNGYGMNVFHYCTKCFTLCY